MKRFCSVLLVVVMLLGLVAGSVPVKAAGSKLIAITFDDGPGPYTEKLLNGLQALDAKCTFFMVGNRVKQNLDTVKRAYAEGHQIANHSWNHPELSALSDSQIKSQISDTNAALNNACGQGTRYLVRAPYGSANARVRSLIGVPVIHWSVDTLDWKYRNATTVKNNVVNNAYDGAIVLLHDIHATSVDGVLAAMKVLKDQGYEFVTVNELFRRRGETLVTETQNYQCKPTGTDLGPVEVPQVTARFQGHQVELTMTAQEGATIYYTTDGSALTQESTVYTGPVTLPVPCTITYAAAYNLNGSRSDLVTETFTLPPVEPLDMMVNKDGYLAITTDTEGADIYYTLDQTTPSATNGSLYTEPVQIQPGTHIMALGIKADHLDAEAEGYFAPSRLFYRDVFPKDWYFPYVDEATADGYMVGLGGGFFKPNDLVTRGQLVTLLFRYAKGQASIEGLGNGYFTDVEADMWYYEPIVWAYENHIVEGYPNGEFKPGRPVSREEACKIFAAFLEYRDFQLPEATGESLKYADGSQVAIWALPYVESMTALGLFQGNDLGKFEPKGTATRAQAATVLIRVSDLEEMEP